VVANASELGRDSVPSPAEAAAGDRCSINRQRLLATLASYQSCLVAYSGGVDSAVVAKAAALALGDRSVAVTGESASLAAGELTNARQVAALVGIRHEVVATEELANPDYLRNAPDRCFHCKTELYSQLTPIARRFDLAVIVNGANVDDLGDYRPGMIAARDYQVRSPLAECGIDKAGVRELARHWGLPVWDKPASPCLSSRIAYGEAVTPERLAMIDQAEQALRALGLGVARVRYHQGDVARIEAPPEAIERLARADTRNDLVKRLKALGFKFVALDLEGFRSGSLNALLPPEKLGRWPS
jgi:uncharacterized protein